MAPSIWRRLQRCWRRDQPYEALGEDLENGEAPAKKKVGTLTILKRLFQMIWSGTLLLWFDVHYDYLCFEAGCHSFQSHCSLEFALLVILRVFRFSACHHFLIAYLHFHLLLLIVLNPVHCKRLKFRARGARNPSSNLR